ncbi:MAG: hypothetical protein K2F72_02955 [Muribaculaceae bacterium]|nr:hypothetical protein [Muribaculaceae bacterium]
MSFTASAQEIYVPTAKGDISPLTRAVVTGNKTGGKTLLAAYGAKLTTSLLLDGTYSSTILPRTSTAFYIFNPKNIPVQAWKIVPLKSKKKNRELPYMKTGAYTGSKTNIDDVPIMTRKITDEIYELRPAGDLKNGEYAVVLIENGVPALVYDFRVETNLPPYPQVSDDVVLAEFNPGTAPASSVASNNSSSSSTPIIRWYFDSDPRGARIFWRVISNAPQQVKNTNESYMTTTPLEETRALNIPGLTYENSADVVIEIKLTKRGYEDQIKRYNVRQALDQQEISGFFELVEK